MKHHIYPKINDKVHGLLYLSKNKWHGTWNIIFMQKYMTWWMKHIYPKINVMVHGLLYLSKNKWHGTWNIIFIQFEYDF